MPETTSADARERLMDALERRESSRIRGLSAELPIFELADILPSLDRDHLALLQDAIGDEEFAEVIGQLDPTIAARILTRLRVGDAADVLEEMPPDEATDVVGELSEHAQEAVLREMEHAEAADIRELLEYAPETAGGRMTTEFTALRETMTVDEALQFLRRAGEEAKAVFYVYVTDDAGRLTGVTSLRDLVLSPVTRKVA